MAVPAPMPAPEPVITNFISFMFIMALQLPWLDSSLYSIYIQIVATDSKIQKLKLNEILFLKEFVINLK